jgi:hypothetical protein
LQEGRKAMSLNTDPKVVKRIAFDFTHIELLTPTLVYVWNAEPYELEQLADEIIGRMAPDFIGRYIREDVSSFQNELFLLSDAHLNAAFRELISRAEHSKLRHMDAYIQLLLEAPCKSDECREDCNEHYRSADNAS